MRVYNRYLHMAMAGALALVELSAYSKLAAYMKWGHWDWVAFTTALAFIGLMLASIVSMSLDIEDSMRAWVNRAGAALLAVQALANMLLVYEHEFTAMPTQVVTRFAPFIDAELALRLNAMVQGLVLSLVSLAFWNVWARMLKREWEARREQKQVLKDLDAIFSKES